MALCEMVLCEMVFAPQLLTVLILYMVSMILHKRANVCLE